MPSPRLQAAVHKQIKQIAADATDEVLTKDALETLREHAVSVAEATLHETSNNESTNGASDDAPALQFHNCEHFLIEFVTVVYPRRVGTAESESRWSQTWWRYAEAIPRLDSLWRAHEQLRHEPGTGMAT